MGAESSRWSFSVEDDGIHGFHWFAVRDGVLWAKGWSRTRSARKAELAAKAAGTRAYMDHLLEPEDG